MGRRSVLLVAALVVAALGTTLVFLYVSGVNDRALAKQDPIRVLVAKKMITAGTTVSAAEEAGAFDTKTISRSDAIPDAFGDIALIKGKAASSTIYAGDQISPVKFGAVASASKVAVPPNRLGLVVTLNDPAQVAGFVTPGARIAIFLTSKIGKNGGGTRVLLPEVTVLAVGDQTTAPANTTSGTETNQVSKTILTLDVDQVGYQRVVFGRQQGDLSLALLPAGFTPNPDLAATTDANLFP